MPLARYQVEPAPQVGEGVRVVVLDCEHGTTKCWFVNPPGSAILDDESVTRVALVRHHQEEQCRCIRRLWRRMFGTPWPEVPLVRAAEAGG